MDKGWEFHEHGGPYPLEELQRRYPQLDAAAISIRRKCIASPIYLASTILSAMWPVNLFNRPGEQHLLVEKAMIAQKDTLYVDARGTAKTTLIDEVGTVWQLLKYPNDTILLTHSSATNAKSLSHSVRVHFTTNPRLRGLFPEYAMDDGEDGNILGWSVPCRTRGGREDSVECGTPDMATAGRHYDVVRSSDWMNENSTPLYGKGTLERMNELVAQFSQVRALLQGHEVNPRAHYTIDSNRWHDADLAGTIKRRDDAIEKATGKATVIKVIRGVTGESGNFRSSWPEVKTPAMIQAIFDAPEMNPAAFAANYRSDPLPDGGMAFKREWFKAYAKIPDVLDIAITVDPAFSGSDSDATKTDRSAIVVSGIDPQGMLYVLETRAGRWDAADFVKNLWSCVTVWRERDQMLWVGIEDTGGSRGLKNLFFNEMRATGKYIPYRDLPPKSKRKDQRIFQLHSHARNYGIYLRDDHSDLLEELLRFGVAEHDDLADAFAYRLWDMYTPGIVKTRDKLPKIVPSGRDDSADGLLKRMHEAAVAKRGGSRWKVRAG